MSSRWILALLCIVAFAAVSGPVAALNPHLNLTFAETVHQNVTFARDFDLVENRTYSLIEGVLTVENPGTETMFDAHIKVINIENLASDFNFVSGRTGSQLIFPKNDDNVTTFSSDITSSFIDLGMDIDEDRINDSVRVTNTHIIFNVTSEYQLLSYRLYNTTGVADLSGSNEFNTSTNINVTSVRIDNDFNDGVVFAVVTINGTQVTAGSLDAAEVTVTINDTKRNYTVLHVPELRAGQQTIYNYNVSSLLVEPPLDINTTYTNPLYETKVLAGERFGVTDFATNIADVGALTILNISIQALGVNVSNGTDWELHNFTLHNLSPTGDYANVFGNGTNDRLWSWVTNGGSIPIGQTYNISYQVQAPDTVPSSGTYAAVEQNLTYTINATASKVGVMEVRVRGEINFTTSKQIISPQDNLSNHNVTWRSVPQVGSYLNVTYTLEKVTLWVTTTRDPNVVEGTLTTTYEPDYQMNLTTGWTGSQWLFNFTDGSSDSYPPPIVWIKPYWIVTNTGGQILNQSITRNGTDTYIKYIYVVNGYWLEVEKNVTSAGDDRYEIQTHVHNRGNGHTPQNLTVTVYDFIPEGFTAFNFTPNYNNLSNVSGQYTGIAYQWDVGLRTALSTSFAPEGDPNDLDEYYLNYTVNGTGDFRVSELYIVGLDPRKVDNANSVEGTTIITGIASTSKELVYLGIVVFLIAINVGNFLMTSRINKKLDKKE